MARRIVADAAAKRGHHPRTIAERPVKDVVFLGAALVVLLPRVLVWVVADRIAERVRGRGAPS